MKQKKIFKKEFKSLAKKLVSDSTIQRLESQHFIFIRVNEIVTVKFKEIKGLSGYFDFSEIADQKTLSIILNTLERELEGKNG
jgi:hypothetical protein